MPHEEKGFWVFFNEIMQGKVMEKTVPCSFTSEANVKTIQKKMSGTIKNFVQEIDQSVVQKSNITIRCGSNETQLKDHQLLHRKQEYDPLTGKIVKGSGCLTYGCCFNFSQKTKISLHAINDAETKDINELENIISTEIKSNMEVGGGCREVARNLKQASGVTLQSENREIIKEQIRKSKVSEAEISQKIVLEYDEPLFCVNRCDETPSAGEIKQISNVDIMTRNMIKSVVENIEKNVRKVKVENEMKVDMRKTDKNQVMQWTAISAVIVIIVYYICKGIVYVLLCLWATVPLIVPIIVCGPCGKAIRKVLDSPIGFLLLIPLAIVLMYYVALRLWKFYWCMHTSNGLVKKLLCFYKPFLQALAFLPCWFCDQLPTGCGDDIGEFCDCVNRDCTSTDHECPVIVD